MRIGQGYDVHKLVEGRALILGGVTVPYEKGLLGHSDADVLVHAVMDALLGAAALGDIGQHFPDTDPEYEGASSITLLREVGALLEREGYVIENIDATVIAQRPKLLTYRPQMAANIAQALHLPDVERDFPCPAFVVLEGSHASQLLSLCITSRPRPSTSARG